MANKITSILNYWHHQDDRMSCVWLFCVHFAFLFLSKSPSISNSPGIAILIVELVSIISAIVVAIIIVIISLIIGN